MKRYGNLWHKIATFENLLCAANKAQKGKRFNPSVLHFNFYRETELLNLQESLLNQTYQPGSYTTFEIITPKKRMISAAPYRDRVVHHALCNIISPCLEEALIDKTYANRVGLGSHRALRQFTHYLRTHRYGAYFRVGGVASNSSSIPLNPPSKGGLPIRFPPFSKLIL